RQEHVVSDRSRILILDSPQHRAEAAAHLPGNWEPVRAEDLPRLLALLEDGPFAACLIDPNVAGLRGQIQHYGQSAQILEMLDIGIAILDDEWKVVWANRTFRGRCDGPAQGRPFLDALGCPQIKEGDLHPFDTATPRLSPRFRLHPTPNRDTESHLSPLTAIGEGPRRYVLQCRDITPRVLQRQKLDALHAAGSSLAGLAPEQLQEMPVDKRIELLKYNLKQSIHEVLNYQVIEIRMLDRRTNKLELLLAEGMLPEAEARELYAKPEGNGVTGYVAARGPG